VVAPLFERTVRPASPCSGRVGGPHDHRHQQSPKAPRAAPVGSSYLLIGPSPLLAHGRASQEPTTGSRVCRAAPPPRQRRHFPRTAPTDPARGASSFFALPSFPPIHHATAESPPSRATSQPTPAIARSSSCIRPSRRRPHIPSKSTIGFTRTNRATTSGPPRRCAGARALSPSSMSTGSGEAMTADTSSTSSGRSTSRPSRRSTPSSSTRRPVSGRSSPN
jgi:hypothetical protein